MKHPAFSGVRDWPLERLFQAAKDVQDLMASPGWQTIRDLLDDRERALLTQGVDGGTILSQPQYAAVFAEVSGLRKSQQAAETVVEIASQVEEQERRLNETVET